MKASRRRSGALGKPLLNIKRETASRMIAEGELDRRVAKAVGVSRRTIQYWKKRPEVRARIQQIAEDASARLASHYERLRWLRERENCLMWLRGKNEIMRRVARERLREMGAL